MYKTIFAALLLGFAIVCTFGSCGCAASRVSRFETAAEKAQREAVLAEQARRRHECLVAIYDELAPSRYRAECAARLHEERMALERDALARRARLEDLAIFNQSMEAFARSRRPVSPPPAPPPPLWTPPQQSRTRCRPGIIGEVECTTTSY